MRRPSPTVVLLPLAAVAVVLALCAWPQLAPPQSVALPVPVGPERLPAAAAPSPSPAAEEARVLVAARRRQVRGQCVGSGDSGRPLAGLTVMAGGALGHSDAEGRFVLEVSGDQQPLHVSIGGGDFVPVERTLPGASGDVDLGVVSLRLGARLQVWLVDLMERPLAGQLLLALPAGAAGQQDGFGERFATRAESGGDGLVRFPQPLPPGIVDLRLLQGSFTGGSRQWVLRPGELLTVTLKVGAPAAGLVGSVVGPRGEPVAAAEVQFFREADPVGGPVAIARTDHAGNFQVARPVAAPERVWPLVHNQQGGLSRPTFSGPGSAADGSLGWGASDLRLQLVPEPPTMLEVVAAESGRAIEDYEVQWLPLAGAGLRVAPARRSAGPHPHGRCALPGAGGLSHLLMVWPRDGALSPSLPRVVAADPGGVVRVALEPMLEVSLRVVTASGVPVPAAEVELLVPADGAAAVDLATVFADGRVRESAALRLACVLTRADGTATMPWGRTGEARELRVRSRAFAPHRERVLVAPVGGWTVIVPDCGLLHLRLRGAAGREVVLSEEGGDRRVPEVWGLPLRLDSEGSLDVPLAAGRWQVRLGTRVLPGSDGGAVGAPLAVVAVAAGQTLVLGRDLRAMLAPAEWAAATFVDGAPVAMKLWRGDAIGVADRTRALEVIDPVMLDATSRFTELAPGPYRAFVRLQCSGAAVDWPLTDWFELRPGEAQRASAFELRTTRVVIEVRTAAGAPIDGGLVLLHSLDGAVVPGRLATDGRVELSPVPRSRFTVRLRRGTTTSTLGEVDATAEATASATFVLR